VHVDAQQLERDGLQTTREFALGLQYRCSVRG
jgi:hypothetical protein